MSSVIRSIVIVAVLAGVIGGGVALARRSAPKKDVITYEQAKTETADVRSFVTATGVVQPWKIVDVKSNVSGRIDRLYVDLGDPVRVGQPIMDIDPTDTLTARNQARADLSAATARQQQAVANLEQEQKQVVARIAAAKQSLANARVRLAQAQANDEAQPKLTKANIAQATAARASAQKSLVQSQRAVQQLRENLSQLKEVTLPLNVETVKSTVEQAAANVRTAQWDYDRQRRLHSQGYVAKSEVEASFARLATHKANLRQSRQRQDTLERENRLQIQVMEARIQEAEARAEADQARINQAEAAFDVADTNKVLDKVRAQDVEAARAGVRQAQAELDTAEAARKQIEVRFREITAARAQIVRSEASLNQASINLGFTKVTAPRTGVIITKNVEQGTVVPSSRASIGSTNALLQIGDISKIWIKCNVDETDIGQVRVHQRVDVSVDAYPDMTVSGKVIRIDPQAIIEQNVTLIPVTVELSTPDPRFKPGMNATCEFITAEAKNVVSVPNEALKEEDGGAYYVQQLVNGQPKKMEVEVGVAGDDRTEIRSGLKEGEEVITRIIEPEKEEATNPLNPFSRFGGNNRGGRGGPGGGGRPGGGGGRPGGGGARGGR